MDADLQNLLRLLPQVNTLLEQPELKALSEQYSHDLVKHSCQSVLADYRQQFLAGEETPPQLDEMVAKVQEHFVRLKCPRIKKVINATGILLHTGLGRAPLLDAAYQQAFDRVRGACDLEFDLETGQRGDRQDKLEDLLQLLTGASAAAVVNNNAAAVLLALNTLSYRKETIVSRGQLIEIGGSFRLPEVLRKSGAKLMEVGTTNRTYLRDYEAAMNAKTGAVLLAHTSNYRVQGFTHEVDLAELAHLCQARSVPLVHDLGGGILLDLKTWELPAEPLVSQSITVGCKVVTFSGDKVLGGPQSGILVGDKDIIGRIRRNPLMRALRPDKFTLACLEETLKFYLSPLQLLDHHPVLARLAEDPASALERAQTLLAQVKRQCDDPRLKIEAVPCQAQLGSGALPLETFPSSALRLRLKGVSAADLAARLRQADPPIIGYVRKESVYLDLKSVWAEETPLLVTSLLAVLTNC